MCLTEAGLAHAGVIAALHGACFATPWNEKSIIDMLAMPGTGGWIVGDTLETPRGFVLYRLAADEAEILTIGVVPEGRRQGFAEHLLQAASAKVGQQGGAMLFLEVAEDNHGARALYEKAGFTPAGRRRGYYVRPGGKIDALIYQWEVNAK